MAFLCLRFPEKYKTSLRNFFYFTRFEICSTMFQVPPLSSYKSSSTLSFFKAVIFQFVVRVSLIILEIPITLKFKHPVYNNFTTDGATDKTTTFICSFPSRFLDFHACASIIFSNDKFLNAL